MVQLTDLEPPTETNNRVIQTALRETDEVVLARAAVAMGSREREIIFRNLSKRALSLFSEEVARAEDTVSEAAANEARDFFLATVERCRQIVGMRATVSSGGENPVLDTSEDEKTVESFVNLVRFARESGILALESTKVMSDFPLTEKGLEMLVDGWDPAMMREILEQMKMSYFFRIRRQLEMIVEGFESLVSEELPAAVEARLRAHLT